MSKKIKISLVTVFLCLWPSLFFYLQERIWPTDRYFLIFCDVGQGDSALLASREFQILIDTGPDNGQALACLKKYLPPLDQELEALVLTHPDQDHIGAAPEIISLYSPQVLVTPPVGKNTQTFQSLLSAVSHQPNLKIENFPDGKSIKINSDASIYFYTIYDDRQNVNNPFKTEQNNDRLTAKSNQKESSNYDYNYLSIGILLKIEQFSAWLSADLEKDQELALIRRGVLEKVNLLKVGHHGAKTSSEQAFLDVLQPENAIISVGKNNRYGHPASSTLEKLEKMNLAVYRTDLLGDIVYIIENGSVWSTSGKRLTLFRFF